jgi:hypothetical protein
VSIGLEYSTLPRKRRSWWKLALYMILGVATLFAAVWLWGWMEFETVSISVTVTNQTAKPLRGVQFRSDPKVLLDIGDIAPGGKAEKSRRFFHDVGPTSFHANCGDRIFSGGSWLVLTGKGPCEYEITVRPDRAHLKRWSLPQDTWEADILPVAAGSGVR